MWHNMFMSNCILFIDGENFLHKVEEVIGKEQAVRDSDRIVSVDLDKLFNLPLKGLRITRKIFYASRLHLHPETKRKSEELIRLQRKLRNNLVKLGYEFIIAGNVRAQKVDGRVIFREKGVDVKIAVDMVSLAADKKLTTAILCSSDSDLQPAITEIKKRGVEVVYLGFENNPNKGLTYTTNRTILLRNSEVLASLPQRKKA